MSGKIGANKNSPAKFFKEVRQEVGRVTWPTRKEATISTIMVLVMVIVASLFFLLADSVIQWGIRQVLGLGV